MLKRFGWARMGKRALPLLLVLLLSVCCLQPAFAEELLEYGETEMLLSPEGLPEGYGDAEAEVWDPEGEAILLTEENTFRGDEDAMEPSFAGHALLIGDTPSLVFYVDIPAGLDTGVNTMQFAGTDFSASDSAPTKEGIRYRFVCPLDYLQLGLSITPTLSYGGGKTLAGTAYSVADYQKAQTSDTTLATLVQMLLEYGHRAELFVSGKEEDHPYNYTALYTAALATQSMFQVTPAGGAQQALTDYVRGILDPNTEAEHTALEKDLASALLMYNAALALYSAN